jgi:hypothetical protein
VSTLAIPYWLLYVVAGIVSYALIIVILRGVVLWSKLKWERIRDNLSAYENGETNITSNDEDSTGINVNILRVAKLGSKPETRRNTLCNNRNLFLIRSVALPSKVSSYRRSSDILSSRYIKREPLIEDI